jgi:hypothetical protein
MKRTVSRFDIAVKVSEEKEGIIADVIPEIEARYKISLNSQLHKDPSGKGFIVTCIQGLKTPQYKVSDAVLDLSTCIRAKCKLQTAIINKSNCLLDEDHESEDIIRLHGSFPKSLITKAEQDNLFDSKAYAADIPSERVAEILTKANNDPYGYLDTEEMAEKAEAGARIEEYMASKEG